MWNLAGVSSMKLLFKYFVPVRLRLVSVAHNNCKKKIWEEPDLKLKVTWSPTHILWLMLATPPWLTIYVLSSYEETYRQIPNI